VVLVLTPSENNLFTAKGLDDWTTADVISNVKAAPSLSRYNSPVYQSAGVSVYKNAAYTTLTAADGAVNMSVVGSNPAGTSYTGQTPRLANALYVPVMGYTDYPSTDSAGDDITAYKDLYTLYTVDQPYTISVVLADGTYSSATFTVKKASDYYWNYYFPSGKLDNEYVGSSIDLSIVNLRLDYSDESRMAYGIAIHPTTLSADIIYMELVRGTEPQFQIGWEAAVYPGSQLEESPVLAVRSNIDVSVYQIGGVRPSYPEMGQVYAMVESGYITSLQIYTGTGWENVDGRIWTGSRWIPASSYNVITLQDMYDIADATPDYEYIYTESGFWDWWQRAWTDFTGKLFDQKGSGSSGASGSIPADVLPAVPDDEATEEDDSWNVLDLFVILKDGAWSVITGVVTTGFESFGSFAEGVVSISNFFGVYDRSNPTCITGMCDYGGDDIWA